MILYQGIFEGDFTEVLHTAIKNVTCRKHYFTGYYILLAMVQTLPGLRELIPALFTTVEEMRKKAH